MALTYDGRVAVYMGDDERFDYWYKFVSDGHFDASNRVANMNLLDSGTLYVAKFNDDGSGTWIPLVFGQGSLTPANGFASQADVLVKTRLAGDAVGATKMDRPEDGGRNPATGGVYLLQTNNTQRGEAGRPGVDTANPRADNRWGHVIEVWEANNDPGASTFAWDIFLLCGDPEDESTYFAGFPKSMVSPIAAPDNLTFDSSGNLWIYTDGQPSALKVNDAIHVVPTQGSERGYLRQFMSAVSASEVCGPEFTPDETTLFAAIQHPGEGGTLAEPTSTWPDRSGPARPAIIAIRKTSGGLIGT